MFQLHHKTCKDFGEFEGFAWHFMYDGTGKITEWSILPFENIRLGKPDSNGYIAHIYYNPYFGTSDYSTFRKDTICYDSYNPAAVKDQLAKQKSKYRGQVLFVGTVTALSRFYPLPEAHASMKWMKIERGVSDYHEDNINNGFLQPFMLAMIGNPDEPVNNPDVDSTATPLTRAEAFDDLLEENFMGAKRVGNMMVGWYANKDELPVPIAFPSNNNGDLFVTVDNQATKKITIAFKVPAILANIHEGVSLGGDANQIRVAVKLMQQRVIKKQRILTDAYQGILRNFQEPYAQEITIAPYNPYPELEVIDDKIWNEMNSDERRDWIEKNTEIELSDEELAEPTEPNNEDARDIANRLSVRNAIPISFPEEIRNSIKKALSYQDKMQLRCVSRGGRQLSEAVISNQSLGFRSLRRMYNYLKKNSQYETSLYSEGCNSVAYHAFGGKQMEKFLESELKRVNAWLN